MKWFGYLAFVLSRSVRNWHGLKMSKEVLLGNAEWGNITVEIFSWQRINVSRDIFRRPGFDRQPGNHHEKHTNPINYCNFYGECWSVPILDAIRNNFRGSDYWLVQTNVCRPANDQGTRFERTGGYRLLEAFRNVCVEENILCLCAITGENDSLWGEEKPRSKSYPSRGGCT